MRYGRVGARLGWCIFYRCAGIRDRDGAMVAVMRRVELLFIMALLSSFTAQGQGNVSLGDPSGHYPSCTRSR